MKVYINNHHNHIVVAPAKAGCSTIERMFRGNWYWDNVFIGKSINDPKNLLQDYIDESLIKKCKVFVIVRNPLDWIISGFRWIQYQNIVDRTHGGYPIALTDHLIAIKNVLVEDPYWKMHCLHQPSEYLRREYKYVKLENFKTFINYLDNCCDSKYDKLSNYNVNKNSFVPYPDINDFEENLILELTRKAAILTNYNVEESIKQYRQKYNSGELNEFLKQNV